MSYAILRVKKLKTLGNVQGSAKHTLREIKTDNADPTRTKQNYNSLKSSVEIVDKIKEEIKKVKESGNKVMANSVPCVEYLFTASPDAAIFKDDKKTDSYFASCLHWLEEKHGKKNIVSFHTQKDETTPHMVIYVFPRTEDGRLSAKEVIGNSKALREMQTSFANRVSKHGLKRGIEGSKSKHTSIKEYYARVNAPTPKPPSALDALKGSQRQENIKVIHAKYQEYKAKARKQAKDNQAQARKIQAQARKIQAQAMQNQALTEEKKLSNKAMATLIRENFDKEELAKKMGVQLKGKGDVIDALLDAGKANNFGEAVALIAVKLRIRQANPLRFDKTPLETPKNGLKPTPLKKHLQSP